MTPSLLCIPDGAGFLVAAMLGTRQVTGAWGSCPYDAAARVCGYLLCRLGEKKRKGCGR